MKQLLGVKESRKLEFYFADLLIGLTIGYSYAVYAIPIKIILLILPVTFKKRVRKVIIELN